MNSYARFNRSAWLAVVSSGILSLTTCFALPALARDPPGTMHVQLVDLNLSSSEGRRTASERIRRAANVVCSRTANYQDLGMQIHAAKCIEATITKASESLQQQLAQSKAPQVANSRAP